MIGYDAEDWFVPGSTDFEDLVSILDSPLRYGEPMFIRDSAAYGMAYEALWVIRTVKTVAYLVSYHAESGTLEAVTWPDTWEEAMREFCDGEE